MRWGTRCRQADMNISPGKAQSTSCELATPILSSPFILLSFMGSGVLSQELINRSVLKRREHLGHADDHKYVTMGRQIRSRQVSTMDFREGLRPPPPPPNLTQQLTPLPPPSPNGNETNWKARPHRSAPGSTRSVSPDGSPGQGRQIYSWECPCGSPGQGRQIYNRESPGGSSGQGRQIYGGESPGGARGQGRQIYGGESPGGSPGRGRKDHHWLGQIKHPNINM